METRAPSRWRAFAPAVAGIAAGYTVELATGTPFGAALAVGVAALICTAVGLAIALRGSTMSRGLALGVGGVGIALAALMAPLWLVRPVFADTAAIVRGWPISASAETVWWPLAALSTIVAIAVLRHRSSALLAPPPGHPGRVAAVLSLGFALLLSSGTAALSLEAYWSDQIPATLATGEILPQGQLAVACSVRSVDEYASGREQIQLRPGARSFADSLSLMRSNGLVEGSVGLQVTAEAQCARIVDADPWVESWVFRFDSPAQALRMYQAGLFGVAPASDTACVGARGIEIGWRDDANAACATYAVTQTQKQFLAYWPFGNYLAFVICRNVDFTKCEAMVAGPGGMQESMSSAYEAGKWFYIG